MNSYREVKTKEVEIALAALQERLDKCPRDNGLHGKVLQRIEDLLAGLAAELVAIEPVIHDPAFRDIVDTRVNRISIFLFLVERQYLRGLATPSKEELFMRTLFLNCAGRLGLNWIEDMVVQGSGELAIYPEFATSLATPSLHVPTGLLDSFLALPGIYHEFGHSVFRRFTSIRGAMQKVRDDYFAEVIRRIGPMQPNLKAAQIKRFQNAKSFWNERRLEELFCDLFGQHVGGCANMVSMIDLSMAQGRPTYEMDDPDYPPDAARVRACELAMSAQQVADPSTQRLIAEWYDYATKFSDSQLYRDACPKELLQKLGDAVSNALVSEMPHLPKIIVPPPDIQTALAPTSTLTLEIAMQNGCSVLAWRRDNFESWWQDAVTRIT